MNTIFFSWQSDLPNKTNRNLIETSIKKAIKSINKENDLSLITRLDKDTLDIKGSPDIANTILDKIDKCDIFIADISLINGDFPTKKTPNPNVMFELGYAVNKLGWDRVICLFNSDYGNVTDLPFDLRNRRVLEYNTNDVIQTRNNITSTIKKIIESNFELLELSREITDYYTVNIYSCFLTILSRIIKTTLGVDASVTTTTISKVLTMNYESLYSAMKKDVLGFSIFASHEDTLNILENELTKVTQIKLFNINLLLPIIQMIKSLKSFNKYINRDFNIEKFKINNGLNDKYRLKVNKNNSNLESRVILLQQIQKEKFKVIDFADINRKDHLKYALSNIELDTDVRQIFTQYYYHWITIINVFIEKNDGDFIIDNTKIEIKKNTNNYH